MSVKLKKVRFKDRCTICDAQHAQIVQAIEVKDREGLSRACFCEQCWELFMKLSVAELKRWMKKQENRKEKP